MPKGARGARAGGGRQKATPQAKQMVIPNEKQIFDSIRNNKKETLIVYDDGGNIVYSENGTQGHTGYGSVDYTGKHTVHNHPKGYQPIPSATDIQTFGDSKAKSMSIVSPTHTFSIREDPNYNGMRHGPVAFVGALRYVPSNIGTYAQELKKGTVSNRQEYYQAKYADEVRRYATAGARSGYLVTFDKNK